MQKNNSGFIATAVLYSLALLISIILFLILKNLATARKIERDTANNAKEQLIYYEVEFDGNGSTSGKMDRIRIPSGQRAKLPKNQFKKTGYEFKGWAIKSDGQILYKDEASVKDLAPVDEVITLFAKYNPLKFTVTFNPNGGTVKTPTKIVTYDQPYGGLPIPTKPDYDFVGWYTAPTGGEKITENTIVKILANQTLYAHWELSGNKVTYNYSYNGGTSTTAGSNVRVKEGAAISLSPTASKSGYTFVGWNTNPNAKTKLTSLTMGKSDVTLYAIYYKTLTITLIDYKGTTQTRRYLYPKVYNRSTGSESVQIPNLNTASNSCGNFNEGNTYNGKWPLPAVGWTDSTSATASPKYSQGESYSFQSNTTLYGLYYQQIIIHIDRTFGTSAVKSANQFRRLNGSGAVANNGPYTFTFIDNARRDGYNFEGFRLVSGEGNEDAHYFKGSSVQYSCSVMYAAIFGH